jgi:hypothetical protein
MIRRVVPLLTVLLLFAGVAPRLGDETAAFKMEATVTSKGRRVTLGGYLVV